MTTRLHFRPRDHWMNDPNGFVYFGGQYHLFYQYFPYDTQWGTMHWGHKTSKNLVHWEDQGVALYPSRDFDRNGCFSGSAIEMDGAMYLYYTSIVYDSMNPRNIHVSGSGLTASHSLLISEDGKTFDSDRKQMLLPPFSDQGPGSRGDTRDPKVWREGDVYYMVLGNRQQEQGNLLLYQSPDGITWQYASAICDERIHSATWECPDIFAIDGQYFLTMSPIGLVDDGVNYANAAVWTTLDFDAGNGTGEITSEPHWMDYGQDAYAAQSTLDAQGDRVMVAWLRMPLPAEEGFIGMLTLPRRVRQQDGRLRFGIHPGVDAVFTDALEHARAQELLRQKEPLKISMDLTEQAKISLGGYQIAMEQGRLVTDRSAVFVDGDAELFHERTPVGRVFTTPSLAEGRHIDVYVDGNAIEIYVNGDEYVLSNIVYGLGSDIRLEGVDHVRYYGAVL